MRPALAVLAAAAVLALVPAAGAATTRACTPVDRTNQALQPDPHGVFGIFAIKATGVACTQARTVADAWYRNQVKRSDPLRKLTVRGFSCVNSSHVTAAQQINVACFDGAAKRIHFRWQIPSG